MPQHNSSNWGTRLPLSEKGYRTEFVPENSSINSTVTTKLVQNFIRKLKISKYW